MMFQETEVYAYGWFWYTSSPSLAAFTRMVITDDEVNGKQWDLLLNVTKIFCEGSTLTVEAQSASYLVYRKRYFMYIPTLRDREGFFL